MKNQGLKGVYMLSAFLLVVVFLVALSLNFASNNKQPTTSAKHETTVMDRFYSGPYLWVNPSMEIAIWHSADSLSFHGHVHYQIDGRSVVSVPLMSNRASGTGSVNLVLYDARHNVLDTKTVDVKFDKEGKRMVDVNIDHVNSKHPKISEITFSKF